MSSVSKVSSERIDQLSPDDRLLFNDALYKPVFRSVSKTGDPVLIPLDSVLRADLRWEYPKAQIGDIEDAIQDTILTLLRKSYTRELWLCDMIRADSYDWVNAIKSYAIQAADGFVLNNRRDGGRHSQAGEPLDEFVDKRAKSPLDRTSDNERLTTVRDLMLCSSDIQTRRLVANVVDDRTDAEIASDYGMTKNAVKQERYRTKRRLRGENPELDDL